MTAEEAIRCATPAERAELERMLDEKAYGDVGVFLHHLRTRTNNQIWLGPVSFKNGRDLATER